MNVSDSTEKKGRPTRSKSHSEVKTKTGGRRAKTSSEIMGTEEPSGVEAPKKKKAAPKSSGTVSVNPTELRIKFSFNKPEANEVYLAGAFNDWNTRSIPLERKEDGTWSTTIELSPGRYEYNFIVDGIWVQDLSCSEMVTNPFGTRNCVIIVG